MSGRLEGCCECCWTPVSCDLHSACAKGTDPRCASPAPTAPTAPAPLLTVHVGSTSADSLVPLYSTHEN